MKKQIITLFTALLFLCHAEASDLTHQLTRAGNLLETGKPDSSAVILYELLDRENTKEERVCILYYLSRAMEQLGRLGEQINYLIMAREVGPDIEFADKIRFEYAQILFETGNLDGCIGIAREFKQHYNTSLLMPDILYLEGNSHLLKGEYLRAFNVLNEITKRYTDSAAAAESAVKGGVCLFHLELIAGAVERLEQYLNETPGGKNTDEALYFLGLSYERSGQTELAVKEFKRLVMEYPSYPAAMEIYFRLGKHYFETNRFVDSENTFENYIYNTDETDKHHDEALLYLERIFFKTGRYSSESEIAENFITKYPQSTLTPGLIFDLALYYKTMSKTEDAIEKYQILLNNSLYIEYADSAAFLLADTYAAYNQNEKALELLKKTAHESLEPLRTQKMFYKLGAICEKWNFNNDAIAWYDSSLAVNSSPDYSFKALYGIARIFKGLNRLYEASNTLERITGEYPHHPDIIDIYLELANIYVLQGRLKQSILAAEASLKYAVKSQKTDILLFIAELYEETDEDEALRLYSLIFNNPQNTSKQRTEALLNYGDLSLQKGDSQAAHNAYARIINDDADSVSVNNAKHKILFINENTDSSSVILPEN